jgi:hypothetical protein
LWPVLSTCIEAIGLKSTKIAINISLNVSVHCTTFNIKTAAVYNVHGPEFTVSAIKGES